MLASCLGVYKRIKKKILKTECVNAIFSHSMVQNINLRKLIN